MGFHLAAAHALAVAETGRARPRVGPRNRALTMTERAIVEAHLRGTPPPSMSKNTRKTHVRNILRKTGCATLDDVVIRRLRLRGGLVL